MERGVLLERARQDWRDMKVVLPHFLMSLDLLLLPSGEEEGQVDPEGHEGVPRV